MRQANDFIVLNIHEYSKNDDGRLGEDTLLQFLSGFSCLLNLDVERFLKQQSIEFAKKHQAATYSVLLLEDAEFLSFFYHAMRPGSELEMLAIKVRMPETDIRDIKAKLA